MEGAKSSGGGGREEVGRRRNRGRISERVERRERSERGESGRREKETRWTGRIHPHGAAVFRAGVAAVEGMLRGRFEGWGCYIRPARGGESSVRPREAYRSRGCDDRSRESHGARDLSSTHDAVPVHWNKRPLLYLRRRRRGRDHAGIQAALDLLPENPSSRGGEYTSTSYRLHNLETCPLRTEAAQRRGRSANAGQRKRGMKLFERAEGELPPRFPRPRDPSPSVDRNYRSPTSVID